MRSEREPRNLGSLSHGSLIESNFSESVVSIVVTSWGRYIETKFLESIVATPW